MENNVIIKMNKKQNKIHKKFNTLNMIVFLILLIYSLFVIALIAWGFITSLKDVDDYLYGDKWALPSGFITQWKWDNYAVVFQHFFIKMVVNGQSKVINIYEMLFNTVLYAGVGSFIATIVPFVVAYVTARYKYWYCKIINAIVIVVIALPIIGSTPSTISILDKLGIYDSFVGIFCLKASFVNMYYLIFYASLCVLPKDFHEAASIDGASELVVMIKIMIPMCVKALLSVNLILFVELWNDYQTPILYLHSYPTLARGIYAVSRNTSGGVLSSTPMRMASSMLLLIPIMIIFSIFSNQLMGGISMGGLKE